MSLFVFLIVVGLCVWFVLSGTEYAYLIGALGTLLVVAMGRPEHLLILPQTVFSRIDMFTLMALPLFILAAELMNRGGVTRALIDFAMSLTGRTPGALGHVNVATSVFFGGVSGSAIADAAALGRTLVPVMEERGYSRRYAASITAASAIIGPIIPPSIIMILYGALTGTDIAALFAAGIVPGLLLAAALMLANAGFAIRDGHPRGDAFSVRKLLAAGWRAAPALSLPLIILGGIVFGVVTPTEAGALAVVAAWGASLRYTRLDRNALAEALRDAVALSGAMFMLLLTSGLLTYLAALSGFAQSLSTWLADAGIVGLPYLALLVLILLISGMFTGVRLSLFVIVPLLIPPAIGQGFDPIHLGIVVCLSLTLGLVTPPFGPVLLVTSAVARLTYMDIVRGTVVFTLVTMGVLILLGIFPGLSLFLPTALDLR
ncbi:MAG: TRAP transporter large permease [Pseudomonadota bacterium]